MSNKPSGFKKVTRALKDKIQLMVKVEHSMFPNNDFTVKDRKIIMDGMRKHGVDTIVLNFENKDAWVGKGKQQFPNEAAMEFLNEIQEALTGYDNLKWLMIQPQEVNVGDMVQEKPDAVLS